MPEEVVKRLRIGIVDDDDNFRETIGALLHDNGFDPILLPGSAEFYKLGSDPKIDLILIDLKLKGESGLSLAIHIRARHDLPIVMLSGVGDEVDKIVGLETGADDYLMKPFNPRELIARIRAVLRRYGASNASILPEKLHKENNLSFGVHVLNTKTRQLHNELGDEVSLTYAEYRLLEYFVKNPDRAIPRLELLEELGSDLSQYMDRTIDVLILRLRRKIESVPSKPVHLQTRRGQGYIFVGIEPAVSEEKQ